MDGIGERLKLARRMARLSQQGLADRAGVSKMAISKYEHNQMMPGSDVLVKLANALDIRMEFLLRSAPELEIKPAYRAHSQMNKTEEASIVAQIQEWLERYLAVAKHTPETLWLAVQTERALGNQELAEKYRETLFSRFPASKETQQLKTAIR